MNNFNGVAEVVAALDSAPVYRLKKTWDVCLFPYFFFGNFALMSLKGLPETKKDIIQQMRDTVGPMKAYARLREKLHTATPPCIPYLGMYLTDLTFIHDGNEDLVEGRKVNFFKCVMMSDVLREIQLYQTTRFQQTPNPGFKVFCFSSFLWLYLLT